MKNKFLLIPISLGGLGLLLILLGSLTTLTTMTALAIAGAIMTLVIVVILYGKKKPPAPGTPPTTPGTTPATAPVPTPAPKPATKTDIGGLAWAIFAVGVLALGCYGVWSVAKFVWTETKTDSHFIQSIPTVRVTSPLLVGHDWKEPAPKKKVRTERKLSFTMEPGQVYEVSKMEMGQNWRFERIDRPIKARVRRTEKTGWNTFPAHDDRLWKADWSGTLEIRSARPNLVEVIIFTDQ